MAHAPMFARAMGPRTRMALYGLACVVLMVLDSRYDAMNAVRASSAVLLHPLQSVLSKPFVFLSEAAEFFSIHGALVRDNRQLQAEHQRLAAQVQGLRDLQAENAHLKQLLALPTPPGVQPVASSIIRVLPDPFSRRIVVDRGTRQGIVAGRPVVDAQGLVGQVTEVFPDSSTITLLTSLEQAAPVQNQRNGLRLIVQGTGADALLEIRYLDMHADLKAGDLLTTSGLDGVYPAGIPVARVLRVEQPRQSPFARALCVPIGAIGQHRQLLILSTATP